MLDCKSFLLGPFGGLAISISGFKGDERQRLVQDIEAGGGKYTGEMAQGQVTHLVVNAPSGSKFDFAVKTGGVKIVNAAWVRACVDMGAHKVCVLVARALTGHATRQRTRKNTASNAPPPQQYQ